MILEVCCADIESVRSAIAGGAQRVELCSALEVGGLTPSAGLAVTAINECHRAGVKVHVLIRPRPGDYVYTDEELLAAAFDVAYLSASGADGVVVGALKPDGTVDERALAMLLSRMTPGTQVTFHRAFDLSRDPFEALAVLAANTKVTRILTSGQAPSAPEGAALIRELVARAGNRLAILVGAGVNSSNAAALVAATGVDEIHASAKTRVPSSMTFRRGDVSMSVPGADEYSRMATSADEVAAIIEAING